MQFREGIAAGQRFRKGRRVFAVKLVRDPDETRRHLVCQVWGRNPNDRSQCASEGDPWTSGIGWNADCDVGADGIRDRLLARPRLPSVVFGEMETLDYSTGSKVGEEHFLTLEIWSEGEGRREAQQIADLVRSLLHDTALSLDGAALVSLLHLLTRTRREPKTKFQVAELRFRAVTEEI